MHMAQFKMDNDGNWWEQSEARDNLPGIGWQGLLFPECVPPAPGLATVRSDRSLSARDTHLPKAISE